MNREDLKQVREDWYAAYFAGDIELLAQVQADHFTVTTERGVQSRKSQIDAISSANRLLAATYWGDRRSREIVERMISGSLCFSLYHGPTQIGFGRAVTDGATFTWVADIVIEPEFRGTGLGKWMMECLLEHPATKGTQMVLQTRDAHGLYERFGFSGNDALMSTGVTDL